MIKMSNLRPGDFVIANYDGEKWEGIVKDLNREDKEVCVETDVQEFWFKPEDLEPIPLNDDELLKLNFQKHENGDSTVKYMKGAFRLLLPQKGNFSNIEMWYREDRRHLHEPIGVHELQNHYHQMTKIDLGRH